MKTDEALMAAVSLWQITQTANQPAQVHMECQKTKDALVAHIKEHAVLVEQAHIKELKSDAETGVSEGSDGGPRGDVPAAAGDPARETPASDVRRDPERSPEVRGKGSSGRKDVARSV